MVVRVQSQLVPVIYYRYVGAEEMWSIQEDGWIQSRSGITWLTRDYYEKAEDAQRWLALPQRPVFRAGPIYDHQLPWFAVEPRRVAPGYGEPGGGWECAVEQAIPVFHLKKMR